MPSAWCSMPLYLSVFKFTSLLCFLRTCLVDKHFLYLFAKFETCSLFRFWSDWARSIDMEQGFVYMNASYKENCCITLCIVLRFSCNSSWIFVKSAEGKVEYISCVWSVFPLKQLILKLWWHFILWFCLLAYLLTSFYSLVFELAPP